MTSSIKGRPLYDDTAVDDGVGGSNDDEKVKVLMMIMIITPLSAPSLIARSILAWLPAVT